MTTTRLPVNLKRINWIDGLRVEQDELDTEQARNIGIDAANVNNFLGSGVVLATSVANTIFDSGSLNTQQQTLFDGYSFDGQNIYTGTVNDVSDITEGVQLSITMSDVRLFGAPATRVTIIGDEFGDDLIHDDLTFEENGTQVTRGRYKSIRAIIFNNFFGNTHGSEKYALAVDSYSVVGSCVIEEVTSMEASLDPLVAHQTSEPSQFFNSFVPAVTGKTITEMLEDAIGADKSFSDLDISLTSYAQRELANNDVTTQIGQKFKAEGDNIQKFSVLLSVKEDTTVLPIDAYDWSGSITMSLYALQTDVSCPVAPVPDTAIDFDPNPTILAQLSLSASDLEKQGIVLDGTTQEIDFVFTGSTISDPVRSTLTQDNFYAFAIHRSGDTTIGTLLLEESTDREENGYMVIYDGSQWVNVTGSDMWFNVYGDHIKVADGIAYEDGVGIQIPKLKEDDTNTEVPYVYGHRGFYTSSRDAYNYIVLDDQEEFSDVTQHQRTGDDIFSRAAPAPSVSLISASALTTLLISNPAPVLLGGAFDENPRGNPAQITGSSDLVGLAVGDEFNILLPDADILQNNLVGSILSPDTGACLAEYRIINTTLHTDAYGDVNGDGVVDLSDVSLINSWIADGYNYDLSNPVHQQRVIDGYVTVDQILRADVNGDGIVNSADVTLITNYINKVISTFSVGSTFSRMTLEVESLTDPLTTVVNIPTTCSSFTTVPFASIPWKVEYFATWKPDLLDIYDLRRYMPTTFIEPVSSTLPAGRNDLYAPGNLIIGEDILNPDATFYSVDLEVNHLSLEIPIIDSYGNPTFLDGYDGILLFDNFVSESSLGLTATGFTAMKYADGSYVQSDDFDDGKVKISVSLQSLANDYTVTLGAVEDLVGMYYDPTTSLITLYMKDLYNDGYGNVLPPLSTKILATVYLKQAGFANSTGRVTKAQMRTLLGI